MSSDEYNASDEEYEYEYTDDEEGVSDEDVSMTTPQKDDEPESKKQRDIVGSNKRRSSASSGRDNPNAAPMGGGVFEFGGESNYLFSQREIEAAVDQYPRPMLMSGFALSI